MITSGKVSHKCIPLGEVVHTVKVDKTDNKKTILHKWNYLNSKFPIDSFIARGGNAIVYKSGNHVRKIYSDIWKTSSAFRELIILSHFTKMKCPLFPQLVHFDIDKQAGELSLVMETCQEVTLQEIEKGRDEILEGLEMLNKHGLIHADLKSSNIMKHNEKCVIIDFSNSEWVYPPFYRVNYASLSTHHEKVIAPKLEDFPQQYYQYDIWAFSHLCCPEHVLENPMERPTVNDLYSIYKPEKYVQVRDVKCPEFDGKVFKSKFMNGDCLSLEEYQVFKPQFDAFCKTQKEMQKLKRSGEKRSKMVDWLLGKVKSYEFPLEIWFYSIQIFDEFQLEDVEQLLACCDLSSRILIDEPIPDATPEIRNAEIELILKGLPMPIFVMGVLYLEHLEKNVERGKVLYGDLEEMDFGVVEEMYWTIEGRKKEGRMKGGEKNWRNVSRNMRFDSRFENKFE